MGRLAIIEGEIKKPEEATISIYDRGFLYGDSVFETVRTYGGALFALAEHLDRLCLLYTSPSPRDGLLSRMPSSA